MDNNAPHLAHECPAPWYDTSLKGAVCVCLTEAQILEHEKRMSARRRGDQTTQSDSQSGYTSS